jgi:hypothetical protein
MSLSDVSQFTGQAIDSAVGGELLLAVNYQILGLQGVFVVNASLLSQFFTIDPTRRQM